MTETVAATPDQVTWTLDGEGLRLGDGVSMALKVSFVRLAVPNFVNPAAPSDCEFAHCGKEWKVFDRVRFVIPQI